MEIKFILNNIDGDWWFEFGFSIQKTPYYKLNRLITIGLGFMSIYIRW
jgi:hypothetical protein